MKQNNKILLLGATGRTGKIVLKTALKNGCAVHCLSRNSDRIEKHGNLTIFEGDPGNNSDLESAITACDSIISVLNISRTSDNPWSKLRTPEKYLSEVMTRLIPIAEKKELKRIVICSAWGAGDSRNHIPSWFKWFIKNSNLKPAYKDHERQEELISNSKLNWTIVRPVGLTNSIKKEFISETYDNIPKPSLTISRNSVAKYLVDSLKDEKSIGKKVVISRGRVGENK